MTSLLTLIVEGNSHEMVSIRGRADQYKKLHTQGIAKNQAFHALFSLRHMLHTQVHSSTRSFIHRVSQKIGHFMPYFLWDICFIHRSSPVQQASNTGYCKESGISCLTFSETTPLQKPVKPLTEETTLMREMLYTQSICKEPGTLCLFWFSLRTCFIQMTSWYLFSFHSGKT